MKVDSPFFFLLSVYLLYSVASIRHTVTWWSTSGTEEADEVASHWATTALVYLCATDTVRNQLAEIPATYAVCLWAKAQTTYYNN